MEFLDFGNHLEEYKEKLEKKDSAENLIMAQSCSELFNNSYRKYNNWTKPIVAVSKEEEKKEELRDDKKITFKIENDTTLRKNNSKKVGKYTLEERKLKIQKFREKQQRRRMKVPLNKKYDGRRRVAYEKFRLNGKFALKPSMKVEEKELNNS